jgi:ribonuclease P protein component
VRRVSNEVGYARILIRVAKQVLRSAVERNRMKRCVREVFRHHRGELASFDFFVSLIQPYKHPSLLDARQELEQLLHR